MTRFQAAEDLSGQAIRIGVGIGDDIAGVNDEIRPLGVMVDEFDNPFGAGGEGNGRGGCNRPWGPMGVSLMWTK